MSMWGDDWSIVKALGKEEAELENLRRIFDAAVARGVNTWFSDWTAYGKSEDILGTFLRTLPRESYCVATEFHPQLLGFTREVPSEDSFGEIFAASVRRLHTGFIDIMWLVHKPEDWLESTIPYLQTERIGRIGFKCSELEEVRKFWDLPPAEGLNAPAVWGRYDLFDRRAEKSGLLEWCEDHRTKFFCSCMLRGHEEFFSHDTVKEIAEAHGLTARQVAVAWAVSKGAVPVIMANSLDLVDEAAKVAEAGLSSDEVSTLGKLAERMKE